MRKYFLNFLDRHPLIHYILCMLCTFEAEWELITNPELRLLLDTCQGKCLHAGEDWEEFENRKYPVDEIIPQNTLYCEDCPFRSRSGLAKFLFGFDCYCLFLRCGDFSFSQSTDLLWDGCKCCGQGDNVWDEEER